MNARYHAYDAQTLLDTIRREQAPDPGTLAILRFPYEVGLLARGTFSDALFYGRLLGLHIMDDNRGGWFVRRGLLVVSGEWRALELFLARWRDITDE